jgi:hypothetical protein
MTRFARRDKKEPKRLEDSTKWNDMFDSSAQSNAHFKHGKANLNDFIDKNVMNRLKQLKAKSTLSPVWLVRKQT